MRSLWMDPEMREYPNLKGDVEADVAIIGAGFSGIGAAWALRESGARTVVLEERTVGSGASGRNAGFVLAGPAAGYEEAVQTLGPQATAEIWQLTVENNRWIGDLVEELHLDCGYLRRGSLSLAASEDEWTSLQRSCEMMRAQGVEVCLARVHELPRPFDRLYFGGMYFAGNAEMQPAEFTRGVARALPAGTVFEHSGVTGLDRQGSHWIVRTATARLRARTVILATNAYTSRLQPHLPISATRGQILSTVPLDRVLVPFPMYANHGYQYWRQTPDHRLVVGGWRDLDPSDEIGEAERLHPRIQNALLDFVERVAGSETEIEYRWAGIMGFTPDMAPLVGAMPHTEGLYIAAGYSGHGVAMAFTCGARAARLAIGESVVLPGAFSPSRFEQ